MPEMNLSDRKIIGAFFTLSRSSPAEPPLTTLGERIDALADVGIGAVGAHIDHDFDVPRRLEEIRRHADDRGVSISELEFLVNWSVDGDLAKESRHFEDRAYAMADALGADHLNVGMREAAGDMAPLELVAERFGALCDRAGAHGLAVAFEFMPFRALSNIAEAWELVRLAERPNGGILLDAWHWFRGSSTFAMLDEIPAESILVIQMCDGGSEMVGSMLEDTQHHRLFPGDGDFDVVGLMSALDDRGVRAPISVEVLSAALRLQPIDVAARRIAASVGIG